ncbi:hypothetical protein PCANC_05140 [Puccinia coronata f. sp. avenae]|uniref:Uncharacterized protein n=1 Tax=Puccinia coronata f. sp. avenae TaxID=200324 RepID=A0A2N5W373_9BASI|nr:hypothetical protein PCANC_05140 [Puccinia coronata f. sp. avenae]
MLFGHRQSCRYRCLTGIQQDLLAIYLLIERPKALVTCLGVLASPKLAVQPMKRSNKPPPEASCKSSYHVLSSKLDWTKQSPPPQPANTRAFGQLNFAGHRPPLYTSIRWVPNRNQAELALSPAVL